MDINLLAETGEPEVTLENLRKYTSVGYEVKDCVINEDRSITVIFDKGEHHAVGFKVGEPCRLFAEWVVEVGLDKNVQWIERFLADTPWEEVPEVKAIQWPGFDK